MKRIYVFTLCLFCFFTFSYNISIAQVSLYAFAQQSGSYTELTGGTSLTYAGQDTSFRDRPIGFTFLYNGQNYTKFGIHDNGFIVLGSGIPTLTNNPISQANAANNVISGFGFGLYKQTGLYQLSYNTTGSAPNRILTVQWKNYKTLVSNTAINFQIKLYETSNKIEVIYGSVTSAVVTNSHVEVGLRGSSSSDFNNRAVGTGGLWSASTAGLTNTAFCLYNSTHGPANGLTYTWSIPPCTAPDPINLVNFTTTTADIAWTAQTAASLGYQYILSTSNTAPTSGSNPTGSNVPTTLNLSGLTNETTYYVWLRSNCGTDYKSNWSQQIELFTGHCRPKTSVGCSSGDLISAVQLNTLSNNSGASCSSGTSGYSDFTSLNSTTLIPSTQYNLGVQVGSQQTNLSAWIDFNDNLTFETNERIVYSAAPIAGSTQQGVASSLKNLSFILPCTANAGTHRLRIKVEQGTTGSTISPCGTITSGEVEDYLVTIAAAPTCLSAGFSSVVNTLQHEANIQWDLNCTNATQFDIEYGASGFTPGTGSQLYNQSPSINANVASLNITGLTSNTAYDFYIRSNCGLTVSEWSIKNSFTTLCDTIYLDQPLDTIVCDGYNLQPITGIHLTGNEAFYTNSQALNGQVLTGPITQSMHVWIYDHIATCSDETSFFVTVNKTPVITNPGTIEACVNFDPASNPITGTHIGQQAGWYNQTQQQSGTALGLVTSDSLVYMYATNGNCSDEEAVQLVIHQPTFSSTNQIACDTYTWNGQNYTQSGTYTFQTTNQFGCDSTASLVLTINSSSVSHETVVRCTNYSWNNVTYTQSGIYSETFMNSVGCDSTAYLHLTINYKDTSHTHVAVCSTYTWNNQTYLQSGDYIFLSSNQFGCDSLAVLHLTIYQNDTSTTSIQACDTYTWNGSTYTQTGTYLYNTQTTHGCDSLAILNLVINHPDSSTSTITACDNYLWNGQNYTSSGTYTFLTTNTTGCDSLAKLILTMNYSPQAFVMDNNGTLQTTPLANATFSWLDCSTNQAILGANGTSYQPTQPGYYAVMITNNCGTNTSDCYGYQVGGLEITASHELEVYPNPTADIVTISSETQLGKLSLLDETGRVLFNDNIEKTTYSINLEHYLPGIYYVLVESNETKRVKRVIKQ
jgi:hypothetical protein